MSKKTSKNHKIIITGGGTGGHAIPLMAIVEQLQKSQVKILYVGSGSEIERQLAKKNGLEYKSVLSGKWRRYFDWQNFIDFFKIIIGCVQSFFIILFFWPEKVFSKGGYVGLPIIWAGWLLGRPIYLHETDSILGLANRMALSKCQKICLGFPIKYYYDLPVDKVIYTGNPISSVFKALKKEKIFKNEKPTILVTGGSQGARFINQTIAKIAPQLSKNYNIVHLCGRLDYEWLAKNKWTNYKIFDFTLNFPKYLYNCDLVISRAGGTIFEIAYCKKPSILVPLASAANNHQENNAKILESEGAAVILREKNLTSESLLEIINRIMEDKQMQQELKDKINQFSQTDAAKNITKELLKD